MENYVYASILCRCMFGRQLSILSISYSLVQVVEKAIIFFIFHICVGCELNIIMNCLGFLFIQSHDRSMSEKGSSSSVLFYTLLQSEFRAQFVFCDHNNHHSLLKMIHAYSFMFNKKRNRLNWVLDGFIVSLSKVKRQQYLWHFVCKFKHCVCFKLIFSPVMQGSDI